MKISNVNGKIEISGTFACKVTVYEGNEQSVVSFSAPYGHIVSRWGYFDCHWKMPEGLVLEALREVRVIPVKAV